MYDITFIQPNILWYVIGYVATDGSLSKDGRHICITSKDMPHLEKIKNALGVSSCIGLKARGSEKDKKYGVLQIGSVKFYKFLNSIGMYSRKTWDMKKLKIPKEYFVDFLRGVIDGDGCIHSWKNNSNNHTQWALRIYGAAPDFISWLKVETENNFFVSGKIHTQKYKNDYRSPMHILKFGKIAAQKIIQVLYYNDCFCLDRKLIKVNACLHDSIKMVNYGGILRPGGETGYTRGT